MKIVVADANLVPHRERFETALPGAIMYPIRAERERSAGSRGSPSPRRPRAIHETHLARTIPRATGRGLG